MEYQGHSSTERIEIRKAKIVNALMEKPKTFTELYNELGKAKVERITKDKVAKYSGWSKSDFTKYLRKLQHDLIVGKRKDKKYVLLEKAFGKRDFEILQKLHSRNKERKKELPELLDEISEHVEPRKVTFMKTNDLILRALINYLSGVESTVRAPVNFQSYARWLLSGLTDEFCQILIACGKRDGDATDFVLQMIKDMLYSQMYARTD